jgi:hypothetical protein
MFKDLSKAEQQAMMALLVQSIDREIAALSAFAESYAREDLPAMATNVVGDLYGAGYKIVKVVKDPNPATKKAASKAPVKKTKPVK